MSELKISDIFTDTITDTEVKRSVVTATVTDQKSQSRFVISGEDGRECYLDFQEKSPKKDKIVIGTKYNFRGLERRNLDSLFFGNSHFVAVSDGGSSSNIINLKDIHVRSPGIINQSLYVKVGKVSDVKHTANGSAFRKIVVSDEYHSTELTAWNKDAESIVKLLAEGQVVKMTKFKKDKFPTSPDVIKHLSFISGSTKITLAPENIQTKFANVICHSRFKKLTGSIVNFEEFNSYKSCPGKGGFCGKKLPDGVKFCPKVDCALFVTDQASIDDYRVTAVLETAEFDYHSVLCFRKILKEFEIDVSSSPSVDCLSALLDKKVTLTVADGSSGNDSSVILQSLELNDS